jgi:hypothetical protein
MYLAVAGLLDLSTVLRKRVSSADFSTSLYRLISYLVAAELASQKIQSEKAINDPRVAGIITTSRLQTENILKAQAEHPRLARPEWLIRPPTPKWHPGMHKAYRPSHIPSPDNLHLEVSFTL